MGYDTWFGFDTTQRKTLEKKLAEASGSDAATLAALQTSITNLNAWATALATKLNADPDLTATDFDTTPQA